MRSLATTLLTVIVLGPVWAARTEKVLWEKDSFDFHERAVLVARQHFTVANIEKIAWRFLRETGDLKCIRLQVYTDAADANPLPKPAHQDYEGWLTWFTRHSEKAWNLAELVAISGSAVLRIRNSTGVRRLTLRGTDPLVLTFGADRVEILHFGFEPIAVPGYVTDRGITVYARTKWHLTPHLGENVIRELRKRLPQADISLYLRNDHWFVEEPYFPTYYPFELGITPLAKQDYLSSPVLRCTYVSPEPARCVVFRGK